MKRAWALVCMAALAAAALLLLPDRSVHVFEGVEGPDAPSPPLDIAPTLPSAYADGSTSRLAVLLTDRDSNWLGLAHGLKTIGVPFLITEDAAAAVRHDVVLVYPIISGKVLDAASLDPLRAHPAAGGTLIGSNVLGGGMGGVFGFGGISESKAHAFLDWTTDHPLAEPLVEMGGVRIKIGLTEDTALNVGTNSYRDLTATPLARYENGDAAIILSEDPSGGRAVALGLDLGQLLLRGYNWRDSGVADAYVNTYQPTLDVLLSLIAELYRGGTADAVTLHTVPEGRDLTVLMTHDVDYAQSIRNAVDYARMHRDNGVRSTFFVQTKYVRDYNDAIFINDEGARQVRELEALGMEVASHSVSHSLQFDTLPLGSGEERYPDYRPRVRSGAATLGASLLGELRVSRFLLETFTQHSEVVSFRPGYLRNPPELPEALARTGYRYSSSATANKSLTHLPFQLNRGRAFTSELDVFEFPITVEDEKLPLMGERLDEATAIADRLAGYGGLFVLLNHPDILGHKFAFEQGFIAHVKPYAWFGTVGEFGDFWRARNAVGVDTRVEGGILRVTVDATLPISGLTLNVPPGRRLRGAQSVAGARQEGRRVILPAVSGQAVVVLQ